MSTVEAVVRDAIQETTGVMVDRVRAHVAEAGLRDAAASRQRWLRWEERHGLTNLHSPSRVQKVETARRKFEAEEAKRREAAQKQARAEAAKREADRPKAVNYPDTPQGVGQFVHDHTEFHGKDSISQMHPELDRFSSDAVHQAYIGKHVRPTNDGWGWGSTRGYTHADVHDPAVRGGVVTKWRKVDEPKLKGEGAPGDQGYKSSRSYRERTVADKVSSVSPTVMKGLDRVRLANYAKPIPEAMTLHHGSNGDFLAHVPEGSKGKITRSVSFSGTEHVAGSFGHDTVYHFDAPKGTRTFRPTDVNQMFPSEDEHVLLKNTNVHITKREHKGGKLHVYGKIVRGGGSKLTEAQINTSLREWLVQSVQEERHAPEVMEALIQEANQETEMSAVETAVRDAIQEGNLRDAAASRLRWIRWEKSHGAYAPKGNVRSIEPRHLQELPDGQKLRLGDGTTIHRKGDKFDVRMPDGQGGHDTMAGKTAQQAAKQAQAMHAEHKASTPNVIEKSEKAYGMQKVKLDKDTHIVGTDGRLLHKPKDPSSPGIVHRPKTDEHYVSGLLPKDAMVKGSKVYFPGDPGHKPESAFNKPGMASERTILQNHAAAQGGGAPDPRAWKVSKTHHIDRDPNNKFKVRDWKRESEGAPWKVGPSRTPTQSEIAALVPRYKSKGDGAPDEGHVKSVLGSGATLRAHKGGGHAVGGFSMPPKHAQEKLRKAGYEVKDHFGQTVITGKKKVQEAEVGTVEHAVQEAVDSLRKASTPEPFSTSRTSNWVARGGGLPAYIQHIAHDLMEKRGKSESNAIQMAIGIVKRWARGGGNVDANTRAAAAKAVAEWEALKGKAKARKAVSEAELAVFEAWIDEHAELIIQEAEELLADDARMRPIQESIQEAETSSDGDEANSKGIKLFCAKHKGKVTPTKDGKCPTCGASMSSAIKMHQRLKAKAKVSEAAEESPLREAIQTALDA